MPPVAAQTPAAPNGAKSDRLSVFQLVMPTTTNRMRTPILISTMIELARPDSLVPRMSSSMHSSTRTMAGRLSQPPSSGEFDRTSGMLMPNRLSSSWLTYWDQPTATAALETPYSSKQAGGDAHRDDLAQGRVGVGVRRAGDRDGAGQFGVAQGRQAGHDRGEQEGEHHRRAGFGHLGGQDEKDAGADGGADAERGQLEQPDGALQVAVPARGADVFQGSTPEHPGLERRPSLGHPCLPPSRPPMAVPSVRVRRASRFGSGGVNQPGGGVNRRRGRRRHPRRRGPEADCRG